MKKCNINFIIIYIWIVWFTRNGELATPKIEPCKSMANDFRMVWKYIVESLPFSSILIWRNRFSMSIIKTVPNVRNLTLISDMSRVKGGHSWRLGLDCLADASRKFNTFFAGIFVFSLRNLMALARFNNFFSFLNNP